MKHKSYTIKNFGELKQLVTSCQETKTCCFDFETTGLDLFRSSFKPTLLSISFQTGSAVAIPLAHQDAYNPDWEDWLHYIGHNLLENPNVTKFAWNAKFDLKIFKKYGITYRGTLIDGMLAKYLLNEERPNGLKDMVRRYLPEFSNYEKQDEFDKIPWDKKPFEQLCKYGCLDADLTLRLSLFFESYLMKSKSLYAVYRNILMPATRVLIDAEFEGIDFDTDFNQELFPKYEKLIEETKNEIMDMRIVKRFQRRLVKGRINAYLEELEAKSEEAKLEGKTRVFDNTQRKISQIKAGTYTTIKEKEMVVGINLASTDQLRELLYSKKGFKFFTDKTTEKGEFSTSEETLLSIKEQDKHGIIEKIISLREYQHIYSTFIVGYKNMVQDDKKLHGTFLITGTVTGRLSSRNPNMQQVPKKEVNPDIKKQFKSPKGKVFMFSDFGQAELRIMAHLSGDETLLNAFKKGFDPNLSVACKKYNEDYEKALKIYEDETNPLYTEWKKRRKNAKLTVFGCIYGIEALKLSTQLSDYKNDIIVTPEEAQQFLNEFFEQFPKVKTFMDKQAAYMERKGYVKSPFGRRRHNNKIYSEKPWEWKEAVRQSVNFPCQSVASDMALFGSILIYWKVKQGELPPMLEISTVHDSLIYTIEPKYLNPWTIYQIYTICKNPDTKPYFGFEVNDVSMDMDFGVGCTFYDEYPYCPTYDYEKFINGKFDKEKYYEKQNKTKHIHISKYPEVYPEYFTSKFLKEFKKTWTH
jgi:DNA polymerase-1